MALLIFLVFLIAQINTTAQNTSFSATNCSNVQKNSLDVISARQVLIVASVGIDCGTCQSQATLLGSIANNLNDKIEIWAAMNFRYNNNSPACGELNVWEDNYGWNNVFMFIDQTDTWVGDGFPTYYVIEPENRTIVKETNSFQTAKATADAILDTAFQVNSINDIKNDLNLKVTVANQKLMITATKATTFQKVALNIFDISGKLLENTNIELSPNASTIDIASLNNGLYFLQLKDVNQKILLNKKILIQ
jgi:hypothetical protein